LTRGPSRAASWALIWPKQTNTLPMGTGARAVLTTRPTAARAVSRFSGVAMVVIGIALLIERFMH
jgi:hypothetical protein